jgi:CHASE1-domain containing sensor protein
LVRGRSLVPWRRRQERPLQTRGRALYLVLFVASMPASFELHASTLAYVLLGLALVVLLGTAILGSRQGRL